MLHRHNPKPLQIRNVVIENAEIGITLDTASFFTVENVTFVSKRPKHKSHPYKGSKGIWLKVGGGRGG